MRRKLSNKQTILSGLVALILTMSLLTVGILSAEEDEVMLRWNIDDTLDQYLEGIDRPESKPGDDDVLLEIDMAESGTYSLSYYLEDGYKTRIDFVQAYEELTMAYHIYGYDGTAEGSDVTQARVEKSYKAIDYDDVDPDWVYNGEKYLEVGTEGIQDKIERSSSNEYPGIAIEVDNKQLIIKWDFNEDILYVLIKGYESGKIMPVELITPDDTIPPYEIRILKSFEDFNVSPTHYYTTDGAVNLQLDPVELPKVDGDLPGSQPGLDITFKQPMELDKDTWTYDYAETDFKATINLGNIGTGDQFDFSLPMDDGDKKLGDLGNDGDNENVEYVYEDDTYTIHLVKDRSDLAQGETFIEWPKLAESSVYNVSLYLDVEEDPNVVDNYEFQTYVPTDGRGYTYMAYELTRASAEEAYLELTPFDIGDQDEVVYTIYYSKSLRDLDKGLWLTYEHNADDDEIFIPVPFSSTSSLDFYQVVVSYDGGELISQVINYKAENDGSVPLTPPTIELVDNLFVVPSLDDQVLEPVLVEFDLEWSAPTNDQVKELDEIFKNEDGNKENDGIYYELSINDIPTDEATNPFEVIKVFKVSQSDDGDYVLEAYSSKGGEPARTNVLQANDGESIFVEGYNAIGETFKIEGLIIREGSLWSKVLEANFDDPSDPQWDETEEEMAITFPGVSYMRMKAISVTDGEVAESKMSVASGLTLGMQVYEVPTVDLLTYAPITDATDDASAGLRLQWTSVDITDYRTYMIEPLEKEIEAMWYTVYIGGNKDVLVDLDVSQFDVPDRSFELPEASEDLRENEVTLTAEEVKRLNAGQVLSFQYEVDPSEAPYLEENDRTDYELDVNGLTVNYNYYTRMTVELEVSGESTSEVSVASSVLSMTTPLSPLAPTEDEIVPLAPENFTADFVEDSDIKTLLEWIMPEEMAFEENGYGFEVFSIVDRSLPDDLPLGLFEPDSQWSLIREGTSSEFDTMEAWRIYVNASGTHFEKYDSSLEQYVEMANDEWAHEGDLFQLIDSDNAPNRVNYYYVRSMKLTGDLAVSRSSWVAATVTTLPIEGPTNLRVDYETDYNYSQTDETVIQFDAPISNESDVERYYIMEVHVKGEEDTEYSIIKYPAQYLASETETAGNDLRLSYLITDLEPGKAYDIKVRIEDRTQKKEEIPNDDPQYPKSSYSEIVVARTDFDQEAYDKDNKYNEYLSYYLEKAEALKLIEYFTITDNADETAVKYREKYARGLIQLSRNSELELYSGDNAINTYYIPSASLEEINDFKVTLVMNSKDHIAGIRPGTVGALISDEIDDIIDEIEGYDSSIDDYYLRIKFFTDDYNGRINGETPSGELAEMAISVVGSTMSEDEMDDEMVDLLETIILSYQDDLVDAIKDDLDKGIDDRTLLAAVTEVLEEVEATYIKKASILFRSYLDNTATSISQIKYPVYIGLMPEDESLTYDVYTQGSSNWEVALSSFYNGRYFIDSEINRGYVTVPQETSKLAFTYGQDTVDMINAYGLTTVFSQYDLENADEIVDKYQWFNALSRVTGAQAGEDTVAYLEGLGLDVAATNLYNDIDNEEALYLYAQTYAYKHNLALATTYITDYYAANDMDQVNDPYQETLLQAVNLGIVPNFDGYLRPTEPLDISRALEILTVLHQGIY